MKQIIFSFFLVFWAMIGFSSVPEAGVLTFTTTDLGTQTCTPTDNVYDMGDIAATDNLTYLSIEIIDDNINTAAVDVMYQGNVQGQMVYSGANGIWIFTPSAPFDWQSGVNTLTAQFVDLDGNTLDITVNFTLIPETPEAGVLTFTTTDLGTQTCTPTDNVYDMGDILSTDNLTALTIEVFDDNINTADVDVMYQGNVQGQMVYSGADGIWIFTPSAPFDWQSGVNTLTTQFVDLDGNTLDVTVNFTYVQMCNLYFEVVNGNGTISASDGTNTLTSPAVLEAGTEVTFTATPDNNYEVKEWTINEEVVADNTSNTLITGELSENTTVTVEYQAIVGINTISATQLNVYPNPVADILMFDEALNFQIYDIQGKLILSECNANFCNMSSLEPGIYILKTEHSELKIIKQ